jgi:hypothetical protein
VIRTFDVEKKVFEGQQTNNGAGGEKRRMIITHLDPLPR